MEDTLKAKNSNNPLIKQHLHDVQFGIGIGQICIRVREIEKLQHKLHDLGLNVSDIYPGKRTRTDGKIIQWKMLFINQDFNEYLPYPFFIEWEEDDNLRIEDFLQNGILGPTSRKREISTVWFAVKDIQTVAEKWRHLLEGNILSFEDKEYGMDGLEIDVQSTKIRFVSYDSLKKSSYFTVEHGCERPFLVELSNGKDLIHINGGYYHI